MISLKYFCDCGWKSGVLDEAQRHANTTSHAVKVQGIITENQDMVADRSKMDATDAARLKARELEVMRIAKARGLA